MGSKAVFLVPQMSALLTCWVAKETARGVRSEGQHRRSAPLKLKATSFQKQGVIGSVGVQDPREGAGVTGFTTAPDWQGWNPWRWGEERQRYEKKKGRERKARGSRGSLSARGSRHEFSL